MNIDFNEHVIVEKLKVDLAKRGFGLVFQILYPPTGNPPRV